MERIGGAAFLTVNGAPMMVKGDFSYSLGKEKREVKKGADGKIHGYVGTPQVGFIEGKITDSNGLSMSDIADIDSGTIILELPNGKTIVCSDAVSVNNDGFKGTTGEGELEVRFEGSVEEIKG